MMEDTKLFHLILSSISVEKLSLHIENYDFERKMIKKINQIAIKIMKIC